jgi:predicted DNA-binding transcriptional regulator AlpA
MSASWLRTSRSNGNLEAPPFIKIGRSVRYLKTDLDKWLEDRKRGNTLQGRAVK